MDLFQIIGPPGCGKTTTLAGHASKAVAARGEGSVVMASLTRAAAAEIASRDLPIPEHQIGTLHSLAFHALDKPKLAVGKAVADWNAANPTASVDAGSASSMDSDDGMMRDEGSQSTFEEIDIFRHQMVPVDLWPTRLSSVFERWQRYKFENDLLDFTDLIEQAAARTFYAPGRPSVLLGDEAQDWSRLEADLFVRAWGQSADMVVLVGDQDQSLFQWRGANPHIFQESGCPEANFRYLKQSYRVPAAVVDRALRLIRRVSRRIDVDYLPTPEAGFVRDRLDWTWRRPDDWMELAHEAAEGGPTLMVLVSCAYMLAPTIAALKQAGIPFANPYRRNRGDWNPLQYGAKSKVTLLDSLLSFLEPTGLDGAWTAEGVSRWMKPLQAVHFARGIKTKVANKDLPWVPRTPGDWTTWLDEGEDPRRVIGIDPDWWAGCLKPDDRKRAEYLLRIMKQYGQDALTTSPRVIVGTVHSVKGGEADRVLLFPDLSAQAFEGASKSNDQRDAAFRLFYVGMTRARTGLYLGGSASGVCSMKW